MTHIAKTEEFTSEIARLSNSSPLKGFIDIEGNNHYVELKFEANNAPEYKTTKVKALDIDFKQVNIHFDLPAADEYQVVLAKDEYQQVNTLARLSNDEIKPSLESIEKFVKKYNTLTFKENSLLSEITSKNLEDLSELYESKKTNMKNGLYEIISYKYTTSECKDIDCDDNSDIQDILNLISKNIHSDKALSIKEAEDYHNSIYRDMPILLSSPVIHQENLNCDLESVVNLFLSRVYSSDHKQTSQFISDFYHSSQAATYKHDILTFIALGIAQGKAYPNVKHLTTHVQDDMTWMVERKDPLTVIHAVNDEELKKYVYFSNNPDIGGFYRAEYNTLVFRDGLSFIHEAAHAIINIIFRNNSLPYPEDKKIIFEQYQDAEKDLFVKIIQRLGLKTQEELQDSDLADLISTLKAEPAMRSLFDGSDNDNSLKKLKLTDSENILFSEVSVLIFHPMYSDKNILDIEFIVRLPHLTYQGVNEATMNHYFGKTKSFWNEYVHSVIKEFTNEHIDFCSIDGTCPNEPIMFMDADAVQFEHCVVGF